MSSFGATLKREREAKGLSLQEISDRTKIGVRLLKALEEEEFAHLPGGIFDRSFLRQYARCVGVDEDSIVAEYLQAIGSTVEPVIAATSAPEMSSPLAVDGYARVVLAAIAVGVAIAAMVYGIRQLAEGHWRFHLRRSAQVTASHAAPAAAAQTAAGQAAPPVPTPPALENAATPGATAPAASAIPQPAAPETSPAAPTATAAVPAAEAPMTGLSLQIDARKEVWVSIIADGQKQWQGTMNADRSRNVEAKESVQLTLGDAGAVGLILNGKPLPPVGHSGEVKTLTISPKGLAQLAQPAQ